MLNQVGFPSGRSGVASTTIFPAAWSGVIHDVSPNLPPKITCSPLKGCAWRGMKSLVAVKFWPSTVNGFVVDTVTLRIPTFWKYVPFSPPGLTPNFLSWLAM